MAVVFEPHAPPPKPREAPFSYRLKRRLHEYVLLTRLHRPIGIFLLLWPTMWALWIAAGGWPSTKVLLVFVAGTVLMRSAGCIINDFADRDFDPFVSRTRERPLAARRLSPYEALGLFAVLMLASLWLVTRLDAFTVKLSFVGAALAISYPFFKRFFPVPQFYLGLAFSWGVPMAFAAESGELPRVAWILFIAGTIWAGIYDTMYAMVDREDDLRIGIKSSAILFGDMDRAIIGILQVTMLGALVLAGRAMHFGVWYFGSLVAATGFFAWQQWLIRHREGPACFRAFLNNHYVGLVVFAGVVLEYAMP